MLTVRRLLKKSNIERPYDPAIPLLGAYLADMHTHTQQETGTRMFITALVTAAKHFKLPKCHQQ